MEVSMLRLTWLTVAQHVFQPALTGRLELISRKIVSCEPGTKAIAVSRFREKLSPANWVQGVTAISGKISRSWAPKKWGPTWDRDISNSAIYATAIYRAYTVSETAGWIYTNQSSMELFRPVVVQHHDHLTLTLDFQGQILKNWLLRNGMADRHGTKGIWVDRVLYLLCDLELWPWPWIFKVKFWKCFISEMGGPIDMEPKGCELIGCYTHIVTLNFDLTHDLDLGFSRSIF